MRSGFAVFSLSIKLPHSAVILSSSVAVIAAKQGAGSTRSIGPGSLPTASAVWESAAHNRRDAAAFRIRAVKSHRMGGPLHGAQGRADKRSTRPARDAAVNH